MWSAAFLLGISYPNQLELEASMELQTAHLDQGKRGFEYGRECVLVLFVKSYADEG